MHSKFGGSSIYILAACPGSLGLAADLPDEAETDSAAEGTAAHRFSEFCLKWGVNPKECIGLTFYNHQVTAEMAEDIQLYVGQINALKAMYPDAVIKIEPKVIMTSVNNAVFGFIDFFCFVPSKRKLIIGDLKYGYVLVPSTTMQIRHYAVSSLDTYQLWDQVDTVEGFICQPRGEHADGPIRWIYYSKADMIAAQQEFLQVYHTAIGPNAPIKAGEHCHYCKASPICRARLERTFNLLYQDAPLHTLDDGEVMEAFKEIAVMKRQIERITDRANELAKGGKKLDGYKLVKRKAFHVCDDEDALVSEILSHPASSVKDKYQLYNLRLKGKTALKDLPGVPKSVVDKHFRAPDDVGYELAPLSDARPAQGVGSGIGRFEPVSGQQKIYNFTPVS